ncbi:MAG: hypothetical protein M0Q14_10705 [Tissierellaceae bacterium]|nr:hypothetical protein [Tissierellaceae bacterium]
MSLVEMYQKRKQSDISGVSKLPSTTLPKIGLSGLYNVSSISDDRADSLDKTLRQTENIKTRLSAIGYEDKIEKPSKLNISNILKMIARPGYAASGFIREFTDPRSGMTPDKFDPLQAFWRGLTGEEESRGADIMQDIGVENEKLAAVLGFALDVVNPLDILNWVSFGVSKAVTTKGLKGLPALEKAFGQQAASTIYTALGEGAENIGASTVGDLSKKIIQTIGKDKVFSSDKLAEIMTKGMLETHSTLSTKIPYKEIKRLAVGFETPLTFGKRKTISEAVDIPGSELITGAVKKTGDIIKGTRVGDRLGKMFSTKYTPAEVPDSVILKKIQEQGVKATERVGDYERAVRTALPKQEAIKTVVPEVIDNSIEIAPQVNNAVQRVVEMTEVEGAQVYQEFRKGITKLFEKTPRAEEDFLKQVQVLFSGTTRDERQLVLDYVLNPTSISLPDKLQPVADGFISWRDSIVKMYKEMGIPIHELENYVPFIPTRSLKPHEKAGLRSIFGTAETMRVDEAADDIFEMMSVIDPNLIERTTQALDPRDVNVALKKPWLSEDPAHMMMVRGTRAIKAQEASGFIQGFLDQYGLTPADLAKLKDRPKGYMLYENVVDATGARMLKKVTGVSSKNVDKIVSIPEEFAEVFNDYMNLFFNQDSRNAVTKLFDKATGVWKKFAYLYNPGHIPRDTTGNLWQGYLMGMRNPKYYQYSADSMKYVSEVSKQLEPFLKDVDVSKIDNVINIYKKAVEKGEIVPKILEIGGKQIDIFEAFQKANEYGVLNTFMARAETPRAIKEALDIAQGQNILQSTVSAYEQTMRKWTENSNNWARFAGYLHQLEEGKSFVSAAAQVKKFYFDYFDLTPFERKVMRRLVPFYTWTRKNIPMELEALFTRPKDFANVQRAIDAIEGIGGEKEEMPDWAQRVGLVKLGDTGKYINPNLPYQDLGRLPVDKKNIANLLASLNPLIRGPIEYATNVEWYSGKPIERYAGEEQDMPFIGALMRLLGAEDVPQVQRRGLGYLLNQLPMLRNIDTVLNPENTRQMSRLGSMVGLPSHFDEEQLRRSEVYEENRRLNELIRLLKDKGIDVPELADLEENQRKRLLRQLGIRI